MKNTKVGTVPRFKNVYKLYEYLEETNKEEQYISQNISLLDGGTLAERRQVRSTYKKSLNHLRNGIDYTLDLLTKLTTFDAKIFLPFLAEYLSITEGEPYGIMSDVKGVDGYSALKVRGSKYYFVTTLSNIEKIMKIRKENMYKDATDIDEYLWALDNRKYICFDKTSEINILDGTVLDEYLENYPQLKRLGIAVANLRLKHPEFEDEVLLNTILEVVKSEKRKKALA